MTVILDDRFKLRRGTAANLAAVNEVPFEGEIVYETDQGLADGKYKIKIGDGITHYNDLAYVSLDGGVESIEPGAGIAVDNADPKNPIVSSTIGSIALSGRVPTYADLPTTGLSSGDAFYVESDGLTYIWNGTAWPASGAGVVAELRTNLASASVGALSTTAAIPYDNTPPQITEGAAVTGLSVTITPRRSTSKLRIRFVAPIVTGSVNGSGVRFAIFRDAGASAIGAAFVAVLSGSPVGGPMSTSAELIVDANSAVATTFSVRWGVSTGTAYLNRDAQVTPLFGAASQAVLMVEEV